VKSYADQLLDFCGQAVLVIDPETLEIEFANVETGVLFECSSETLLGKPITEFETGLQEQCFWEETRASASAGVPRMESTLKTCRGLIRYVVRSVYLRDLDGHSRFVLTLRDISSERAIENLAASAASQLAATLEATTHGLLVLDLDGKIQNFNRRFAEFFSLPPQAGKAKNSNRLLTTIRQAFCTPLSWDAAFGTALRRPDLAQTYTFGLSDGRWVDCAAHAQTLRGKTIGVIWTFTEVTHRMRQQEALAAARDAAEKANRAKSHFLSAVGHELRAPLNAILGFTQLLEFDAIPNQEESLQTIRRAGEHLLALIDEVLDFAYIEAGHIDLHIQQVRIADVIQEAIALTQSLTIKHAVTVLNKDRPSLSPEFVMADPVRLRQILINLISNGIKYNHRNGSVTIQSRMSELPDGAPAIAFEVSDTGIGIVQEDFDRLFQPFSHIGNAKNDDESSGLGLALVHKLTRLMRGQVKVESTLGAGSRFVVELPAG